MTNVIPIPTDFMNTIKALGGEGILSDGDLVDLGEGVRRAYELMKDGQWHSPEEIERVTGQREGLRRARELRRWFDLEKKTVGKRRWLYRLAPRTLSPRS
jgi:hypothetical protein